MLRLVAAQAETLWDEALTVEVWRLPEDRQGRSTPRRDGQFKARGRGRAGQGRAAAKLDELADRCAKVARQIKQRVRGEKITDRLISLSDPDARPIRKGKLGKPNEFGYVAQIAEITPNTKRGARGLVLPAASLPGNPGENRVWRRACAAHLADRTCCQRPRLPEAETSSPSRCSATCLSSAAS